MESSSRKMRAVGNALGLNLTLVAPAQGVTGKVWGETFLRVSQEAGPDLRARSLPGPLLPVPQSSGEWMGVGVTSSEAGRWLKQILAQMASGGYSNSTALDDLTGHGMKSTTLSWLSKWGASPDDRLILGHHSLKGRSSLECYSRDIQASPLRALEQCMLHIRKEIFRPDLGRSGYILPGTSMAAEERGEANATGTLENPPGQASDRPCQQEKHVPEVSVEDVVSEDDDSSSSSSGTRLASLKTGNLHRVTCPY